MSRTFSSLFQSSLRYFFNILIIGTLCIVPSLTSAQTSGVGITPALIEETLDPGAVEEYTITVNNRSDQDQEYFVFTRNISGVSNGGNPIFAESNLERTGYELQDWITLPVNQVMVSANSQTSFTIELAVPENASPGSHFGGVFISAEPPKIENSGAAVGYQVANIISIRVSGEAIEESSIRQFSTSQFLYGSQNVDFSIRIENSGNVLVRPIGPLEIYNMLGELVDNVTFNENQAAVFPGDTRTFSNVSWEGDSLGFGRYEAILSPVYGDTGAKKTMSSTVTFWILPMNVIGPALAVLATLLLVIYISVRVYVKRSLAHLGGNRRVIRRRKRSSSIGLLLTVVTLSVTGLFLIVLLALFA